MTPDDDQPARAGRFRRLLRRLGLGRRSAPGGNPAPAGHRAQPPSPPAALPPAPGNGPPPAAARQWPAAPQANAQPNGHARAHPQPGPQPHPQPGPAHPAGGYAGPGPGPGAGLPANGRHAPGAAPPRDPAPDPGLLTEALAGLAMRDLTMVESLLDIVGSLEDSTEDPDLLAKLFEIDNLATRMRRNGENLLVLADQESDDSGVEPVALLDVARAATSEIRNYSRVQIGRLADRFVAGEAADDISHLLAELMDNATNHSPDHAQVVISAQARPDGGVLIVVEDEGIGIPQDQLSDINTRLAGTPVLDKRVMRHMGLYVASRIAHRHGLRVQLEPRAFRGVNAYTVVPAALLSTTGPRPQPGAGAVPDAGGATGPLGRVGEPAMAAAAPQPSGGGARQPGADHGGPA
ncbi:sensor histidine kinase, partial [Streptomonospora sediminis]